MVGVLDAEVAVAFEVEDLSAFGGEQHGLTGDYARKAHVEEDVEVFGDGIKGD